MIPGPVGDVPVRIYRPHGDSDSASCGGVRHGGGFVLCDLDSHDSFCRAMSRHTETVVVSVDYRLAPEHRAPAAAEDVFAALCWVIDHADELGIDPSRVLIAGDSAGGNLAAVAALMCRERGAPMPAGQVLIYPVIEPFFDTESYRKYSTGYVNTRDAMQCYWRQYLDDDSAVSGVSRRACAGRIARGPAARGRRDRRARCPAERGRVVRAAAARRECACGASRLPGTVPRVPDDHAVRAREPRPGNCCGPTCGGCSRRRWRRRRDASTRS